MINTLFVLLQTADSTNVIHFWDNWNWTIISVFIASVPILLGIFTLLIKFGGFKESFNNMTQSIDKMDKNITKNTHILRAVTTFLYTSSDATTGLFESNSPITLTDIGKEVLNVSGGKEYVDNNIDGLIQKMEEENLKTALDVQNYSSSLLFQKIDDDNFKKIKNFIYNNPNYKKVNISSTVIIKTMSIYLRDKYLDRHPNLLDG